MGLLDKDGLLTNAIEMIPVIGAITVPFHAAAGNHGHAVAAGVGAALGVVLPGAGGILLKGAFHGGKALVAK